MTRNFSRNGTILKVFFGVATLGVLVGAWFVLSYRTFQQVEAVVMPRACLPVIGLPGTEDMALDPKSGRVFISSLDRRRQARGDETRGRIALFDPADPLSTSWRDRTNGVPRDFSPIGISFYQSAGIRRLFVVNDTPASVLLYNVSVAGDLTFLREFKDQRLSSPNSVVAVGPSSFYVTNDVSGGHLEELRKVLVKALIGVALGCVIGFWFADRVVDFLTVPLDRALKKYTQGAAVKEIEKKVGYLGPELKPWLESEGLAPKQVLVDPGQMVNLLRRVSPGLTYNDLTPYRFNADNFDREKLPGLCMDFSEHSDSGDSTIQDRQKYLWSNLSSSDQTTVKTIAKIETVSDEQFGQFLDVMNRLVDVKDMVEGKVFADALVEPVYSFWDNFKEQPDDTLPKMYATFQEDPSVDLNRRINRVLITRQFVGQCNELRLDLIPLEIWESVLVGPQSLTATEPFMIWVKAGLVSGFLLASPGFSFRSGLLLPQDCMGTNASTFTCICRSAWRFSFQELAWPLDLSSIRYWTSCFPSMLKWESRRFLEFMTG